MKVERLMGLLKPALYLTALLFASLLHPSYSNAQSTVPQSDSSNDYGQVEPVPITPIHDLVDYPAEARRLGIEGKVIAAALIDTVGSVTRVKIERSGGSLLDTAAVMALMKARFHPATLYGKPVRIWFTVPINFELVGGSKADRAKNLNIESEGSAPATPMSNIMDRVKYPAEAKQEGLEGKAVVSALIGADGSVEKTIIEESTDKIFEAAAMDAVKSTRFKPSLEDGKPVRSWFTIPIMFKLSAH